jgi:Ca2+-transporting ATPase
VRGAPARTGTSRRHPRSPTSFGVDPERGLSADEARSRLQSHGPNRLAGGKRESAIQAFLRQYRDFMQIILLAAAVISLVVTGDVGTFVVLAGLTVFNAVIGLRQEAKAEESVKALAQMLKTIARVRRDGQAIEIDAEELVPGDVVEMEAGNRVPADGRICVAATLEIEEAALTGESLPVAKGTDPVLGEDVALGDRTCMAYMNTSVTRGRGEMVVTATGMDTEIGHIADLLAKTEADKTPLQKQLDSLSKIIAEIAAVALPSLSRSARASPETDPSSSFFTKTRSRIRMMPRSTRSTSSGRPSPVMRLPGNSTTR